MSSETHSVTDKNQILIWVVLAIILLGAIYFTI
jgi:hypothetical protein